MLLFVCNKTVLHDDQIIAVESTNENTTYGELRSILVYINYHGYADCAKTLTDNATSRLRSILTEFPLATTFIEPLIEFSIQNNLEFQ